jgi:uncharacterized membrane protein YgdD (TMEM256/DUF423 family)
MIRILAALSMALAIGAGAFGAHGATGKAAEYLDTGSLYQMVHGLALLMVADVNRKAAWLLFAGASIFSGTLYLMAMGLPRWLGAITPIGGVLMITGWLWITASFRSSD